MSDIIFIPYPGSSSSGGGSGGIGTVFSGSITNPGQNGNVAQAVQGINGGVPLTTFEGSLAGIDRSANEPAAPSGSTLIFSGQTLNLLKTISANPSRHYVEVNNTTGVLAVVVIDDGNNTAGTVSMFPLAPGSGANLQGGGNNFTDTGRIRIYGTTGTFCYAREF